MRTGRIDSVWKMRYQATLASDALAGAITLELDSVMDIEDPTDLTVTQVTLTQRSAAGDTSGEPATETVTVTDVDRAANTLTTSPLASAWSAGDRVETEPPVIEVLAGVWWDDDVSGEPAPVRVPHELRKNLPLGPRDPGTGEVISAERLDDGEWIIVDVPGTQLEGDAPTSFQWSKKGGIAVGETAHRFRVPFSGTVEEVALSFGTGGAPTGSAAILDVLKDGASIFGATKVEVAAGELDSDLMEPATKEVTKGDILKLEWEQIGSANPGADPTIYLTLYPSEDVLIGRIEVEGPAGPPGADGSGAEFATLVKVGL